MLRKQKLLIAAAIDAKTEGSTATSIQANLDSVAANPRANLARRSSVMALNNFNQYDAGTAQTRELGVVKKAGDATRILRTMYSDAEKDFERLTAIYAANDIAKDLPVIPVFEKDQYGNYMQQAAPAGYMMPAVNSSFSIFNSLVEKVVRLGGKVMINSTVHAGSPGYYVITLPDASGPTMLGASAPVDNVKSGPIFEQLVHDLVNFNAAMQLDLANNGIDPR